MLVAIGADEAPGHEAQVRVEGVRGGDLGDGGSGLPQKLSSVAEAEFAARPLRGGYKPPPPKEKTRLRNLSLGRDPSRDGRKDGGGLGSLVESHRQR